MIPDTPRPTARSPHAVRSSAVSVALALAVASCAARPLRLPAGIGTPLADVAAMFGQATAACRGVRTITATLALSGTVRGEKLRGRVIAGFERPSALRLEGMAPVGPPIFILVAREGLATLLLSREDRVLVGAPPAAVLEAIAGVSLSPDDLRGTLTGCLTGDPSLVAGRSFDGGWIAIDLSGGGIAYLREQAGGWRIVAGRRERLAVDYSDFRDGVPRTLHLRVAAAGGPADADLTISMSEIETNVPINPAAFSVKVPAQAMPLTLDELQRSGLLGQRR